MQAPLRERPDSLAILVFLWALALLYHELAYRLLGAVERRHRLDRPGAGRAGGAGLAGAVREPPPRPVGGAVAAAPVVANHWFFEAIVGLALVAALGREALRAWSVRGIDRERLFSDVAPVLRVQVSLLYAIAAFHKLDRDYLDPQVSCAVHIHRLIAARLPFYPSGPWVEEMAIPVSLLIEAGLPLLLLVPRTRLAGLVIGALFHLALSRSPFPPAPSASAGCCFSLRTLPARRRLGRDRGSARRAARACAGGRACRGPDSRHHEDREPRRRARALRRRGPRLRRVPACCWDGRLPRESASRLLRLPRPAFLVFPLLVLLNGLSPYFGLKTQTAFSMFSNLRPEGGATITC